jgi:hypothetical protein
MNKVLEKQVGLLRKFHGATWPQRSFFIYGKGTPKDAFNTFLQTCKPDSVFPIPCSAWAEMVIIYLAVTLLQQSCCLPSSQFSRAEHWANSPYPHVREAGIRGITAHKVYPKPLLPIIPVSSYLTFSPLSQLTTGTVIFCGTFFPTRIGTGC